MFAAVHSAPSSAGPKYGVNGVNAKGYPGASTVPARFSVHVFGGQKPPPAGYPAYYPASSASAAGKLAQPGPPPYVPTHPHHAHPAPPPRINTATVPVPVPVNPGGKPIPIPAPPRQRTLSTSGLGPIPVPVPPGVVPGAGMGVGVGMGGGVGGMGVGVGVVPGGPKAKFTIYPSQNAQDTFIYCQGSKSDLMSVTTDGDFESTTASPTESLDSTSVIRDGMGMMMGDIDLSSIEPSPVEPPTPISRRTSWNGGPPSSSSAPVAPVGFNSVPSTPSSSSMGIMSGMGMGRQAPAGQRPLPVAPGQIPLQAFPPHMLAAMHKTPSESSLDNRERIAIANAQYNSAPTGAYYASSSSTPAPPTSNLASSCITASQQQAVDPSYDQSLPPPPPASAGGHSPPNQQQQQPIYTDTGYLHSSPESMHATPPSHPYAPQRSRSITPPGQAQIPSSSMGERPASRHGHEARRSSPPASSSSHSHGGGRPSSIYGQHPHHHHQHQQQQVSSSPPTEYGHGHHDSHSDRERYGSGRKSNSNSPPAVGGMQRQGSSYNGSGNTSITEDGYVPRRERRQSVSFSSGVPPPLGSLSNPGDTSVLSYSSSTTSSGSGSSSATATEYPSGSRRERERERERDRDRDRERERDRDRDHHYASYQQQQQPQPPMMHRRNSIYATDSYQPSTIPFASTSNKGSNSPPSPPQSHRYHGSSHTPSSSPPERAPTSMRNRTSSMSRGMAPPDLSKLSLADDPRGPRHPDISNSSMSMPPPHTPGVPPTPSGELPPTVDDRDNNGGYFRKRRMSVVSQVSETGSLATTLTGATAGTSIYESQQQQQQQQQRSSPDAHHYHRQQQQQQQQQYSTHHHQQHQVPQTPSMPRRMSDGDRSVSGVRYDSNRERERERDWDRDRERERDRERDRDREWDRERDWDRERERERERDREQRERETMGQKYTPYPEPHRRLSDGDQNMPPYNLRYPSSSSSQRNHSGEYHQHQGYGGGYATNGRNVRWDDNLICPSPVLPAQKRKGWFNRRGDQLWTNDGLFRPAPPDQQYPPDLDDYPEHGEGWQNEDGVRIDMEHRRVPKVPRRSALKQGTSPPLSR